VIHLKREKKQADRCWLAADAKKGAWIFQLMANHRGMMT
jgi:hypothetical protein